MERLFPTLLDPCHGSMNRWTPLDATCPMGGEQLSELGQPCHNGPRNQVVGGVCSPHDVSEPRIRFRSASCLHEKKKAGRMDSMDERDAVLFSKRVEDAFGDLHPRDVGLVTVPSTVGWTVNPAPQATRPGKEIQGEGSEEEEGEEDSMQDTDVDSELEEELMRRGLGGCRQLDMEGEYDLIDEFAVGSSGMFEKHTSHLAWEQEQASRDVSGGRSAEAKMPGLNEEEIKPGKKVRFSDEVQVMELSPLPSSEEERTWEEEEEHEEVVSEQVSNPQKYTHYYMDWKNHSEDQERRDQMEAFLSLRRTVLRLKPLGDSNETNYESTPQAPVFNPRMMKSKRTFDEKVEDVLKRQRMARPSVRLCIEDEND